MSLYNKYRPKDFNQLIHSKFKQVFEGNFSHHAYLFFGPPGVGKTSAARLCMAGLNKNINPDSFIDGTHPDYHEINCAVNNGVDEIREIISGTVSTLPFQCKHKFIVFDEAHMLTAQAQNALLKTTEEPPTHVKFIFCTTEVNKVIPAIRSRCQLVPFSKLSNSDLISIIEHICVSEKISFSKESLELIASCSDGSGRAAINLLEQTTLLLNDPSACAEALGTLDSKSFNNLTLLFCSKKTNECIKLLDEIFSKTNDHGSVMNQYADYIANCIVTRLVTPSECQFDGKQLMVLAECVTNILKDFKILQNIKLISKLHFLKGISKL